VRSSCLVAGAEGTLFHTRGPVALKLPLPKLLCVRGTRHVLSAAFDPEDDFRKTTRDLMVVLFTTDEMATSSLTGSKGHTGSTKVQLF